MSTVVSFADWLRNYSSHTYKDTTVDKYEAALEKGPDWLGITLKKPIMEHLTIEEYNPLYEMIVSHENFDTVNKVHGNGEFSAALNAFKKYLAFLAKVSNVAGNAVLYSPEWFAEQAKDMEALRTTDHDLRSPFVEQFGPGTIVNLSGKALLTRLFYSDIENKNNMCYMLEFHPQMREIYGSIAGGSAFKFGLFYHRKNQCWMTGSPGKPQKLSEEEAIGVAESIRDSLIKGAEILDAHTFVSSVEDYEALYEELSHISIIDNVWVLKYYQMLYPEILPVFYSKDYQIDVLRFLKMEPSHIPFVRMGQIMSFVKKCGISSVEFAQIYYKYCAAGVKSNEDEPDTLADTKTESIRY